MAMRMKLFDDVIDSPVRTTTAEWDENELAEIITPYSKSVDAEVTNSLSIKVSKSDKTSINPNSCIKRSLFSGAKRPADDDDEQTNNFPTRKRCRPSDIEDSEEGIIDAVDKLTSDTDLVADGSRDYTLPTIPGKHSDLKSISAKTLTDVLNGDYDEKLGHVTVVDCRYPYEYEGGHIKGAVNLYTKDDVYSLLQKPTTSDKPHILIFHCEFSSERGPKMYRFLRSQDRELNKDNYPKLNFPEIYLLDGGYKTFYFTQQTTSDLCKPMNYKPMLHADHGEDLRHFRKKSKSWTAGDSKKPRAKFSRRKTLNF